MSYMHIDNLYKSQEILLFKECYAMEKIHGTSTKVSWLTGDLRFSSGGVSDEQFKALFAPDLADKFKVLGHYDVTVYGEGYGGKCQGMKATYGKSLAFVAFEVEISGSWLSVPQAEDVCSKLGLPFVHYRRIPCDLAAIDGERDAPSEQAFRNGCADRNDPATYKIREGVVLRPLIEVTLNNGARVIAKHKRVEFAERATIPEIDPTKREMIEKADAVALEFVTDMRLTHVLDKLGNPRELSDIPRVIEAMIEDVTREAAGEIVDSKAARKAIGARAVKLYKARVCVV